MTCRQLGASPKMEAKPKKGHSADTVNVERLIPKLHNGPNKWPKTARQLVNLHEFAAHFFDLCDL